MDEKSIFNTARKISDAAARDEYLRLACGDDAESQKRIQDLLVLNASDSGFLENPPSDLGATESLKDSKSQIGERIGPYKLLQEIGEGGMGTVYMAEQTEPVKRRVALKIIKAGMDTKQVVARFEAERQALAMMDHPNIARLLDVGTTDSRPYFVMELVKGVPITEYCDDKRLSVKQRLELFTSVCSAVQHAHQKGIIHRDLKPSNILVAEYDDKVVPKIIDFGLAKALHQSLTDMTMFTQFGQVIGTLAYMSPEQSKMNQLDVDTRTDIYSLGVLLYELLTGTTPFEAKRLKSAAIDQVLKIIREEEPPKPSTRISDSGNRASSVSEQRRIAPGRLRQILKGELDWVVMKALEKDRGRRYQNTSALADDLKRYLNNETVNARPPSVVYRATKFVKKNRVSLMTTASILILALIAGSIWRYSVLIERKRNERFTAQQNTNTQIDSLQATSGIGVPFVLENLDGLPRDLVLKELQDRFPDANGQQKLNLAYGLAQLNQVEVEVIVGGVLDENTNGEEVKNIVIALSGNKERAIGEIKSAAAAATQKQNWQIKVRLAMVAMYLGDLSIGEEMLASTKPDPIQRTTFISEFPNWGGEIELLAEQLGGTDSTHLRSGVCLSLGGIERPDQAAKDAWNGVLQNWYLQAPDGGTHSASRWAMNQWKLKLPPVEETKTPTGDRDWWHAPGLRFVRIPSGNVNGYIRPIVVSDDFWMCDSEITVEVFQRFVDDDGYSGLKPEKWKGARVFERDNSPDLPVQRISWFESVMFCNWLSWKLGLVACYEIEKREKQQNRFLPKYTVRQLSTNGIRLPTDAEWEFACRAGTATRYSFGDDATWLGDYGWFVANSNDRAQLVATKCCNSWGLFDMHGNVSEWCWDEKDVGRSNRGGSWFGGGGVCQSWNAEWDVQETREDFLGFRVARSLLSHASEPSR